MSIRALAVGLVLMALGFMAYSSLGGSLTATSPSEVPAVSVPDADTAAGAALNGADASADYIAGLSPGAWQVIIILLATGGVIYVFRRNVWLRWLMLGLGIALVAGVGAGVIGV